MAYYMGEQALPARGYDTLKSHAAVFFGGALCALIE